MRSRCICRRVIGYAIGRKRFCHELAYPLPQLRARNFDKGSEIAAVMLPVQHHTKHAVLKGIEIGLESHDIRAEQRVVPEHARTATLTLPPTRSGASDHVSCSAPRR